MADVKIVVSIDSTAAQASAKLLEAEVKKLGAEAGAAGKESGVLGTKISGLIPTFAAASLAADAIRAGLRGIKNALSETIGAAIEQEDVDRALRASLELTGRTVAGNYEHYKKFAEAQQLVTKFADQEIQTAQNLLIQMTRLDQRGINRATKGAMGLASVFKMDLYAATSLVQKAMEGNFGALGRYGIRVKETGTLEEKRADLLRQLDGLYGRATAATETFSGKVAMLKNAWGDAQEEIGKAVTQSKEVQALMQTVMETIRKFTPEIKEYISGIAGFIGGIANVVKAALEAIDTVRTRVGGTRSVIDDEAAAWDRLTIKLGGFSGVVSHLAPLIKGTWAEFETLSVKLWESFNEIGGRATLAAIAAGKFGADAQKAFAVVGGETLKLAESLGAAKGKVDEVGKAHETAAGKIKLFETALTDSQLAIAEEIRWLRMLGGMDIILPIIDKFGKLGDMVGGALGAAIDFVEPKAQGLFENLVTGAGQVNQRMSLLDRAMEKFGKTMETVEAVANAVFPSMNAVISQAQANREIAIENEYKKRLAVINATITDEEAKQKAIMALEAEYQIKRTEARAKGAKAAKAVALMEAVVNTASGVSRAFKDFPFPLSAIVAGIVGALGAVQVGLIAAQPIPLARGALFKKPTLMPGADGRDYALAEAGSAEIVSPEPTMRRIVREELGRIGSAFAGAFTVNIQGPVFAVQDLSDTNLERSAARFWKAMEGQARIRGFQLGRQ